MSGVNDKEEEGEEEADEEQEEEEGEEEEEQEEEEEEDDDEEGEEEEEEEGEDEEVEEEECCFVLTYITIYLAIICRFRWQTTGGGTGFVFRPRNSCRSCRASPYSCKFACKDLRVFGAKR